MDSMDESEHRRTRKHYYLCSFCGVTSCDRDDIIFAQITEAQAHSWNPNVGQRRRYDVCNLHFQSMEFSRRGRGNRLSEGAIPIELRPPTENEDVVVHDSMIDDQEMIEEYLEDEEMMGGEMIMDNGREIPMDNEEENFVDEAEQETSDDVTDGDVTGGDTSEYIPDSEESNTSLQNRYEPEEPAQEQDGEQDGVETNNEGEEDEPANGNDLTAREIAIMTQNPKFYLGIVPEYLGLLSESF